MKRYPKEYSFFYLIFFILFIFACTKKADFIETGGSLIITGEGEKQNETERKPLTVSELIRDRMQYDGKIVRVEGSLYYPSTKVKASIAPIYYLHDPTISSSKIEQCAVEVDPYEVSSYKDFHGQTVVVIARFKVLESDPSPNSFKDGTKMMKIRERPNWLGRLFGITELKKK